MALSLALAGLASEASPATAADACSQGPQAGPDGHRYQLICTKRTFAEAKAAAVRAGGHLVTIGSAAENAFVFDLANVPEAWSEPNIYGMVTGPWIGFAQDPDGAEPAGGWKWVTGESVGYTNWAAGEPNDFEGSPAPEDRAVLWGPGGVPAAVWNDIGQAASIPSIIEFERPRYDLAGVLRWRDCRSRPCTEVPIPNADRYRVEARRAGGGEPRQAVVGRTGAFRFRSLPAGTWLVYPQIVPTDGGDGLGASEWHPATRRITLESDVSGVNFLWCGPLKVGPAAGSPCPEVRVSGRLVDALGDPYGGVEMTIASENATESDTTDARGRFSFTVPRGSYVIRYDGPGGPRNRHPVDATRDRTGIVVSTGRPRAELTISPGLVNIHIDALPAAGGRFVARIARRVDLAGCVGDALRSQRRNEGADDVTFTNFEFEVAEGEHFCGGRWTAKVVWRERNRTIVDEEFRQP